MKRNRIIIAIVTILIICISIAGIILANTKKESKKIKTVNKTATAGEAKKEDSGKADKNSDKDDSKKDADNKDKSGENETSKNEIETTSSGNEGNNSGQSNIENIDPNKPMIALTFDDGPSREVTPRILDALEQTGGRATFFLVGYNIDGNEDIIKRAYDLGCELGGHTYGHVNLIKIADDEQVKNQVNAVNIRLREITGQEQSTTLLRPPYGSIDERVMGLINNPVVLWSVDTEDWKFRNAEELLGYVEQNSYDGAILLMHDLYPTTADGIIPAINWLKEQGYQLVTVSEMIESRRGEIKLGVKYGEITP